MDEPDRQAMIDAGRGHLLADHRPSRLDEVLPPPVTLASPFTGEVVDRDDPVAVKKALEEIEEFIDKDVYGPHRQIFRARDDLKARLGQLKVTDLPRYSQQSDAQKDIDRCPRCRTRLPRIVVEDPE